MSGPADRAGATRAAGVRAVCAAAFVALLVFIPTAHGGYVYDDHRFVEENAQLGHTSILWRAFTDPSCQTSDGTHAGLWRPLRTLSFALDRAVSGSPAAAHVTNVLLHACGSAGVAALLLAWRLPAVAAAAGASVYAVHPAQAETVAWISSRGDLMSAALVWAALVADAGGRARTSLVLGACALLSKEQAVVWPLLAALSARLRGTPLGGALRAARHPMLVTAAFLVVRHLVLDEPFQEGGLGHGRAGPRVLAGMLGHQAWFTVLPVGSVFDWQMPWDDRPPLPVVAAALAVPAALFSPGWRGPAAWFLAALVPTLFLQAFVPLNILVADRFLVFALPAASLVVARCVALGPRAFAAAGGIVVGMAALTFDSLPAWRSDAALWGRTADAVPAHGRAHHWLGVTALREGRIDAAQAHLFTAAMANPSDAKVRYQLAVALERAGIRDRDAARLSAALENYRASIEAFGHPRAEGTADLLPLARLAEVDLTLALGDLDGARRRVESLVAGAPPDAATRTSPAWSARRDALAGHVAEHLDPALARRLLDWGGAP